MAGRLSRPASISSFVLLVLVVSCAPVVAGCQKDEREDPKLAALRMQAIVQFDPPGGKLLRQSERDEHTSLGKPIVAMVHRVFVFETADQAREGRSAAVDFARSTGWTITSLMNSFAGRKELVTGEAMITISDYVDEDEEGARFKLLIRALHQKCPSTQCSG